MQRLRRIFGLSHGDTNETSSLNTQQVLSSQTLRAALRLQDLTSVAADGVVARSASAAPPRERSEPFLGGDGADLEAAPAVPTSNADSAPRAAATGSTDASDFDNDVLQSQVLESFLLVSVAVHPFRNQDSNASLALRWVCEAFARLRQVPWPENVDELGAPLVERECDMSLDDALVLFYETVASTLDGLSMQDLARRGLSHQGSEAILRSLHMLHSQAVTSAEDRHLFDPVLFGMLTASCILMRLMRLFTGPTRREHAERFLSTTIASFGGVVFNGASQLRRIFRGENRGQRRSSADGTSSGAGGSSELASLSESLLGNAPVVLVKCPLCRAAVVARQAIRQVRAGDSMPACCVCTENPSSVCLPCGHLCLCAPCFEQLPRATDF